MFDHNVKIVEKLLWSRRPPERLTVLGIARTSHVRRLQKRTGRSMLVLRGKWRDILRDYTSELRPEDRAEPDEILYRYLSFLLYLVWQNEEVLATRLDRWVLIEWRTLLIDADQVAKIAQTHPAW